MVPSVQAGSVDKLTLEHAYLAWTGYIKELSKVKGIPLLEVDLFSATNQWKTELVRFLQHH